jgi:hypothetical protein
MWSLASVLAIACALALNGAAITRSGASEPAGEHGPVRA